MDHLKEYLWYERYPLENFLYSIQISKSTSNNNNNLPCHFPRPAKWIVLHRILWRRSPRSLVLQEYTGKVILQWPRYDYCTLPSIQWRSRLLYEFTRLYLIYSGSFVVPKASLHLHLLTWDHSRATYAVGASVRTPVSLFEQHKHVMHPLGLPHSTSLGASRFCSTGV